MSARTAIRWSPNDVVGAMPVVAGVCWSVSILLTNLGQKSLTGPFGLVDTAGYQVGARALVWALVALFVLAGAVTARQMGDWQAGARSGLACGLGAGVIAFAVTVLMRIAFAHWLGADGGFDPTAYGLEAALKAGLWHVVFGLLAGGALGAFGGILSLATPGRADAA
jgi:hypothetical protein